MSENQKQTGRTAWDFLASLTAHRGAWVWTSVAAWVAIAGGVLLVSWGVVTVQVGKSVAPPLDPGTPYVHWVFLTEPNLDTSRCETIAELTLSRARPTEPMAKPKREQRMSTVVAVFPVATAWISCIDARGDVAVFVGASGFNNDKVLNLAEQLGDSLRTHAGIRR